MSRASARNLIRNLIINNNSGPSKPIDPAQFKNLTAAERMIQNEPVENMVIFDDISKQAIAAFEGDRHSVGIPNGTPLSNMTLTHNHPDPSWGGTLSFADMHASLSSGVRSIRAVGRNGEGGYILRAGRNANPSGFAAQVAKDQNTLEVRMNTAADNAYRQKIPARQARQNIVGVLHSYYKKTASQYGFTYTRRKRV
jgi:hypothetical protein